MDIIVDATTSVASINTVPSGVILEAIRRLNAAIDARGWADRRFVMPPRITRVAQLGRQIIRVVTLYRGPVPQGRTEQQLLQSVIESYKEALNNIEGLEWSATAAPHNPARNGSIEFWTSGRAGQTRTREESSSLSVDYEDNPVGPDDAAIQQRTVGTSAGEAARALNPEVFQDILYALAVVAVPVSLAWAASSATSIYRASRRRSNPMRRRSWR